MRDFVIDAKFSYPDFPEYIESNRLVYNRFSESTHSVPEISEFMNHPSTEKAYQRYPYDPPQSEDEIREYIKEREWERGDNKDMRMYYIYTKNNSTELPFIGTTAAKLDEELFEVGFFLSAEYWGKEYASEIAYTMMELAFKQKQYEIFMAQTEQDNSNAIRSLEKTLKPFNYTQEDIEVKESEVVANSDKDEIMNLIKFRLSREEYNKIVSN